MNGPRDPDFIIVGAMKAGTTTLADLLSKHHSININKKELHFFNGNLSKGIDWYREQLSSPPEVLVGEGTPTYSFLPHVPWNIYNYFPSAKIIWVLRDPVHRTWSNYLHNYKKGVERRSFEQSVNDELSSKNIARLTCYIERSLYVEQVKRYLRYFGMEQMHFTVFERLIEEKNEACLSLTNFLEVDPFVDDVQIPHSNKTLIPSAMPLYRPLVAGFPGRKVRGFVSNRVWPKRGKRPDFPESVRSKLLEVFQKPNEELKDLLGMDVCLYWASPEKPVR